MTRGLARQCAACREQFTVTVKTVFERSKIPECIDRMRSSGAGRPTRPMLCSQPEKLAA